MANTSETESHKAELRTRVLAARRTLPADVHAREAAALTEALTGHVQARRRRSSGDALTVCGYAPAPDEPGSLGMLDALVSRGVRVLLPVVPADDDPGGGALRWGDYRPGTLVRARFGLLEPPPPVLPAHTITEAEVIVVPAIAVDRRGVRLGRGGGFYDRSLALLRRDATTIAVIRDDEFVDDLPAEPHDVPVNHALTPRLGVVELRPDTDTAPL